MVDSGNIRVAYFSTKIALEPAIPTYSGGLGVLAGDTLRSVADLGVPFLSVALAHRRGHFLQRLNARGNHFEEDAHWRPKESTWTKNALFGEVGAIGIPTGAGIGDSSRVQGIRKYRVSGTPRERVSGVQRGVSCPMNCWGKS